MVSQSVCNVVNGRVAGEGGYDTTETEGTGNGEDRTEHQLRLHGRESDVPEFLPSVLYTVNRTGFVKGLVDTLKTCDEGEERSTEGGPECNHDDKGHNVVCVLEPEDRSIDNTHIEEETVYPTVCVTGEESTPDEVYVTGDGRSVEDKGYDRTNLRRKFIDEPCNDVGNEVGCGTGDRSEDEGVLQCSYEEVVVKEQRNVVVHENELRPFEHVERREAQHERQSDGDDREDEEQDHERCDHEVGRLISLHKEPCPFRVRHLFASLDLLISIFRHVLSPLLDFRLIMIHFGNQLR